MQTIVLDATTKTLVAKMAGAVTTTNPDFVAAWADDNGTTFTEGASDGALNGTASVTLVAAPAASTRRVIKTVTIQNRDTVANTITISYNDNGTLRQIAVVTLQPGDTWSTDGTYDNNGNLKTVQGSASLIIGTTAITGATNTNILYNNNGVLGQYTLTGSGTVVAMQTAPTFITSIQSPKVIGGSGTSGTQLIIQTTTGNGTTDAITFAGGNNGGTTFATLTALGFTIGTTAALTAGTIELGAVSDTTISRVSAGLIAVEGVTVVLLSTTQTLTNKTLTAPTITTAAMTGISTSDLTAPNNHAITVTANAGSASQSFLVNTFTNSSAATMAITIPVTTPTPKDGQFLEVRIYDFSAVAQTIGWTNTENSTVSAPTTSNGSTTLPLSVLFQFNAATSKWRCVASS